MLLANDLRNNTARNDVQVVDWPRSRISRGDWAGVQFFSPYLVERFRMIMDGELFPIAHLGDVADVGPNGRTITMYMKQSSLPGKYGWRSIYGNETDRITSIQVEPYTYVIPKPDKIRAAKQFWSKRARLLLPERIQPNIVRAAVINSTQPTVGTSWTGVRPRGTDKEMWSKAMSVYLNSTLGIISLLGVRIPRKLMYPRYSLEENQRRIPVPKVLTKTKMRLLCRTYDVTATEVIGQWDDHGDPVRTRLDCAVGTVLKLDEDDVRRMRFELSREPMVTGKRYIL